MDVKWILRSTAAFASVATQIYEQARMQDRR